MIKTKLRGLTLDDAETLFQFRNDTETNKQYIGNVFPNNLELEKKWIESLPGQEPKIITFGIEADAKLVGFTQLKDINYIHNNAEYSILIGKPYQNKGAGKEGTQLILDYGFKKLNLRKIFLYVLEINQRALDFYTKLGFKSQGVMKEHIFSDGEYLDLIYMELFDE